MICITITQESRRLALADMLNAGRQCDLLEVRLDRFGKAPEVGELLASKRKPVIMSCRRTQDGGHWDGSEADRQAILRQCIVSQADYVELELDIADAIPPFPPAKRVISYTNLKKTPRDIADIYAEAQRKRPDVIKLCTPARTPEEAWPLAQILAKPAVPTVVVGLDKSSVMLSVLGRKIGSPWTYAALERGMEAFPGQPTVRDLEEVYHYRAINPKTRLIGVTGFSDLEYATVAGLNAGFAALDLNARCLPLQIGNMASFKKLIGVIHMAGVVVDPDNRRAVMALAQEREKGAERAGLTDLLVPKADQWHGHLTFMRGAIRALESALRRMPNEEEPLKNRMIMVVGISPVTKALLYGLKKRGGIPILASHDRDEAMVLAQANECRFIPFEGIYSTAHDVLIVCCDEKDKAPKHSRGEAGLRFGYLKPTITVMDLSTMPRLTPLLHEAGERGCVFVAPRQVLTEQVAVQVHLIAGKEPPHNPVLAAIESALGEEE